MRTIGNVLARQYPENRLNTVSLIPLQERLTGNLQAGARLKLEAFGLWHYFATGAFGDDAGDRNGLVPVAAARGAQSDASVLGP